MVELPLIIRRLDGKDDVLRVFTYLVEADVPFLCGKRTIELEFKDRYKEQGIRN